MKLLNVGEKYQKNGEEKVAFKAIGEIFTGRNGKEYAKLYHMPGILIHVFEEQKKDQAPDAGIPQDEVL